MALKSYLHRGQGIKLYSPKLYCVIGVKTFENDFQDKL